MSNFNLQILTPDKVILDRFVEKVIVRTTEGDIGILKNHVNYMSAVKDGLITIFYDNDKKQANLKDGFILVLDNKVTIMVLNYVEL